MPPSTSDASFLWNMVEAARDVAVFISGKGWEGYESSPLLRAAVERKIEIIGEAARRVSAEFQAATPSVPSQKIVAQRHVLAHEYGDIKHDRIWRVATVHVPELVRVIEPLIPPPPADPEP
jgi:uncharacterized protein with HEPN domain